MALPAPRPVRSIGEPCDVATEACELGSGCLPPEGDPTGATTCVAFPGEGEACTAGCALGFHCAGDDIATRVCSAAPGLGEPCNFQPTADACAAGLYCDNSGGDSLCATATAEGEPCEDFNECGAGFECREDIENDTGDFCQPEEALICI